MYNFPATFSCLNEHSIGGTCSQLLWHARNLTLLGHKVQVLGATAGDLQEEGVEFIGSSDMESQKKILSSNKIAKPDIIFLEGAFDAAEFFRSLFPNALLVNIGQNIDQLSDRRAFAMSESIDVYAFVSPGHLADYCVRYPRLRHKFLLVRNIVPWTRMYREIPIAQPQDRIAWVGAWTKQGLRQWAQTMERILKVFPRYEWVLYGPDHSANGDGLHPYIFRSLNMPKDRVKIKSLPLPELFHQLSTARVVLVSLGNETACISALDAHAVGRPVISGDDMVFKYVNIEGAGLRVSSSSERYRAIVKLLTEPALGDALGACGKQMILRHFAEDNQRDDLAHLLSYLRIKREWNWSARSRPSTRLNRYIFEAKEKLKRKIAESAPNNG
jgi:glycosyltransferase involved in cell wall biosynthesis